MSKLDLNPYDMEKCKAIVENHYLDSIYTKFGTSVCLSYDRSYIAEINKYYGNISTFHRRKYGICTPRGSLSRSIFSCPIFYYLDYALPDTYDMVLDLGCGENLFKGVIPKLHGIDYDHMVSGPDQQGLFNEKFVDDNTGQYECIISICSIHFVSLVNFLPQLNLFVKLLKPGGKALVTFNAVRMLEKTRANDRMLLFNTTDPSSLQIEEYIDQELEKSGLNFLVIENFISEVLDEPLDGNIRLVIEV